VVLSDDVVQTNGTKTIGQRCSLRLTLLSGGGE
jgi:hypothetical protein